MKNPKTVEEEKDIVLSKKTVYYDDSAVEVTFVDGVLKRAYQYPGEDSSKGFIKNQSKQGISVNIEDSMLDLFDAVVRVQGLEVIRDLIKAAQKLMLDAKVRGDCYVKKGNPGYKEDVNTMYSEHQKLEDALKPFTL